MRKLTVAFMILACSSALAQSWPAKPIRMVIPFPPGGATDVAGRAVADRISPALGQTVLVENRAGGNGNIGVEAVVRSAADGYTILVVPDQIASNPHVYKLSFDAQKELMPVIQLSRQPVVLGVHPSLGVNSVAEFIAKAKQKPGAIAYATSGAGSQQHIAAEWFSSLAGISLTHIPYKGGGQAITDFIGGQVQAASLGSTPVIPHHKAGKVKIIAQTTRNRAPTLPDVPTYLESGFKDLVLDQWLGVFVPTGTPREIVDRLHAEIAKALTDPSVTARFERAAMEPVGGTTEQFAQLVRENHTMYARLVKDLKIRAE
ncbi:MAG: tripartite tricarboxylate transporter substrate binding protein [Betaproteobacteria bacterium]|nr:tripartite tricarboxylate transporter substrate binding protein [Betaproteobacteria bacterium]